MVEIDKLNSGNVTIKRGKKADGKVIAKSEKGRPQKIEITVNPGKTTAFELTSILRQLDITETWSYNDSDSFEEITGKFNENIGGSQLGELDDFLEIKLAVAELQDYGIKIEQLPLDKAISPDFIRALKDLKDSGIDLMSFDIYTGTAILYRIVEKLTLEKSASQTYMNALKEVAKLTDRFEPIIIEWLTPEKAASPAYITALKELKQMGFSVDRDMILYFKIEQAENTEYMKAIKSLMDHGIEMNYYFLGGFKIEKATNPGYINSLIELKDSGIPISSSLIDCLSVQNANNASYIKTLKELANSGFEVDHNFISGFGPEKATNIEYVKLLKEFNAKGVEINQLLLWDLTLEKATNKIYIGALKILLNSSVKINYSLLSDFTLEKGANPTYIQALKSMLDAGVKIDYWLINCLSLEKASDPEYMAVLLDLQKAGINIDGWFINLLTPNIAKDSAYLTIMKDLKLSGMVIDSFFITYLPAEIVFDVEYINTLKDLLKSGIAIRGYDISHLTMEKAKNPVYIRTVKELSGINLFRYNSVISYLSLEKGTAPAYTRNLSRISASGISISSLDIFLNKLSLEKGTNDNYIDKLIESGGDFEKADLKYASGIIGREISDYEGVPELINIYLANYQDSVAEEILFRILKEKMLPFVHQMNDLHEGSNDNRISVIKDLSAVQLFILILCGSEEIYTSTFNLIFNRLIGRMKKEDLNAYTLIKKGDPRFKNYRKLMSMCSSYGRLKEFLATGLSRNTISVLIKRFTAELSSSNNKVQDSISIAELICYEKDDIILNQAIICLLDAERTATDPEIKKYYGIICSICFNIRGIEMFKTFNEKYPLEIDVTGLLKSSILVNFNNEIIERQYYYDDNDGTASFNYFMKTYSSDKSWQIEDKGTFIIITKQYSKSFKMRIFANKPSSASEDIDKFLGENRLIPVIIIHRGHSYHVGNTIKNLSPSTRIVFMGSCGGFNETKSVLELSPHARIISTKGLGTMYINEPLIKNINEILLSSKGAIDWDEIWRVTREQLNNNPNFNDYIKPDSNIASSLIKAFNESH